MAPIGYFWARQVFLCNMFVIYLYNRPLSIWLLSMTTVSIIIINVLDQVVFRNLHYSDLFSWACCLSLWLYVWQVTDKRCLMLKSSREPSGPWRARKYTWLFYLAIQFSSAHQRNFLMWWHSCLSSFLLYCILKRWHWILHEIQKSSLSSFSLESYQ